MSMEHKEHRIYDECGHDHREGDPGTVHVWDVGICCEDGYLYSVCYACHTDDGEMTEDGPWEQAWPCDAAVAQERVKVLEEALCWLVNICCGVGKDGLSPTSEEGDEAILNGQRVLAGKGE